MSPRLSLLMFSPGWQEVSPGRAQLRPHEQKGGTKGKRHPAVKEGSHKRSLFSFSLIVLSSTLKYKGMFSFVLNTVFLKNLFQVAQSI